MVTILSSCPLASEREREAVDAIVGRDQRALDQLEAAGLVESAPGTGGRADGADLRDLLFGAVFDERTGAVAISHGVSSFLLTAAGESRLGGEGMSFAGGLNPIYDSRARSANQTLDKSYKPD